MIITVSSLMYTKSPSHIYSVCSSIDITSQTCGHIYLNHTTLYTHPFISYFSALAWARPLPLIFRSCTHVQCVYPHIVQSVIQVLSYTHARTIASPHLILFTHCLTLSSTIARLSIPMLGADSSPRASTRAHRDAFAANILEILPLFLGAV